MPDMAASGGVLSDRTRLPPFASVLAARVRARLRALAAARHSMGARLLIAVVLFSGAVTLILTAIQVYMAYRRDVSAIDYRLTQISDSYLDGLAEGLATRNEQQLQLELQQILVRPDIGAVEVRAAGTADDRFVVRLGEKSESSAIAREYALRYKGQGQDRVIGTLRVEATLADVYRRLLGNALTILAVQATQTFLVCLFVLHIFRHLVTRHLSAIAAQLGSHHIGDQPLQLRLRRRPPRRADELERLITAFNTLSYNLHIAYRDLHERERALRDSEELKRRIIESSKDCIKVLDLDGNLLFMSSGCQHLLEIDDIQPYLNSPWIDFWPPEDRPKISEAIAAAKAGGVGQFQAFAPSAKGAPRWWDVITTPICNADGEPDQLVAVSRDITERKRAEAEARESEQRYHDVQMELAHATRVATVGQLTASIAHEVSQPVSATVSNAQAALRFLHGRPPDLEEVGQALACIVRDGSRAGDVIGRIRELIKKAPPRKDRLEINAAILEVIELTHSEAMKNGVSVKTELALGLPLIRGDRVQLQQVILNLVINAIEAMSSMREGTRELLISTGRTESAGVLVTVRDSGPGLEAGSSERVLEAFYTTKPGGLGLGLSISRSILEAHRGRLWANSNVPRGAMFQFTVPAHSDSTS
jgi:PAS domain S-box-containing protein